MRRPLPAGRLRFYKITQRDFDILLEAQNYKCAICRSDTPGGSGDWHIDHDHATNKVRGILCCRCNLGLGYFKDDLAFLKAAQVYLEDQL
jgi:hypothetical protein